MHIQEYLAGKAKEHARASRRIKDFHVFDFNYIPERPLMRTEVRPLIDALLRYAATGIANHTLILGSRGSGKTLMVRYICQLLKDKEGLEFVYANCR